MARVRYCKDLKRNRIMYSSPNGLESKPEYLQQYIDNAKSTGLLDNEIEVGWEEESLVKEWIEVQDEGDKTYSDKRREEFIHVADQLDMIYWDKVNDTNTFVDYVAGVKDKYQKP